MKTIKTQIGLLLFMAFSLALNANTFNANGNDTLSFMEVKGKILKRDKTAGMYQVQLIYNNTIQETKIINDEKPFVFTVTNNKDYIIKVIKEGYADKTLSILSRQLKGESTEGIYRYEFVVNLEANGEQSNFGLFSKTISEEAKVSKNLPEFNWKRKYCRKVTPLP